MTRNKDQRLQANLASVSAFGRGISLRFNRKSLGVMSGTSLAD